MVIEYVMHTVTGLQCSPFSFFHLHDIARQCGGANHSRRNTYSMHMWFACICLIYFLHNCEVPHEWQTSWLYRFGMYICPVKTRTMLTFLYSIKHALFSPCPIWQETFHSFLPLFSTCQQDRKWMKISQMGAQSTIKAPWFNLNKKICFG